MEIPCISRPNTLTRRLGPICFQYFLKVIGRWHVYICRRKSCVPVYFYPSLYSDDPVKDRNETSGSDIGIKLYPETINRQ